jgi:P-type Mg2+ transporter
MLARAFPSLVPLALHRAVQSRDIFWRRSPDANLGLRQLQLTGLSSAEAARRLEVYGPNEIESRTTFATARKLIRRLTEPLILILVAAALVSAWAGDQASVWIIMVVVIASIMLDFIQEHRAERASEALREAVAIHADVVRDGIRHSLPARALVPGDIVELCTGDLIPADGIVLVAHDAFTREALLTGEPYPVEKIAEPSATADPAEARNALFAGSSMVGGTIIMLVVATGGATRFGAIAAELLAADPPTAFERDMRHFGGLIMRLTIFLVLFVVLAQIAFARPPLESFLFAIALAVGLTPELLPMITTVTLSRGAVRLAAEGVIVKRLAALHDLGAMDVLCTDKTGTLTEAKIVLAGHVGPDGAESEHVFRLAWLNGHFTTGIRSPLSQAILDHGQPGDVDGIAKIDEVPFDFERRKVSILIEENHGRMLIVDGAPEDVLAHSTLVEVPGKPPVMLDTARRASIMAVHDRLASEGKRLLGVAWRPMPPDAISAHISDEEHLIFAGFAVFLDPPKMSAKAAIEQLRGLGIAVKIVSGDNDLVVRNVATAVGIDADRVLTGREIARLDDAALAARVDDTCLFCRVDPAQKTRVIAALRARGHTVGYLGDGINDAPSLRLADVGISVDGAVDVAKQASDLVLTKPDLAIVAAGAIEGRRTFANIRKYVLMGTSSNFGNMISMAAASVFLPFLPMLPIQILLNNLIYDVSEIGIPFDKVDLEETAQPQMWNMSALRRFAILTGLVSTAFDLLTFWALVQGFGADPAAFRTAWFMESMATQILVIFIVRTHQLPWISTPDWFLTATSLGALIVALVLPFTPLGQLFQFVPISLPLCLTLVAIVGAYLLSVYAVRGLATKV